MRRATRTRQPSVDEQVRQTILVVSHEASRSGAPAVAVDVLDALRTCEPFAVPPLRILIHRWGGPARSDMDVHADVSEMEPLARTRVALRRFRRTRRLAVRVEEWAAGRVLDRHHPRLVWCNTVLSANYVTAAQRRGIPVVLHAHESRADIERLLDRYRLIGHGADGVTLVGCAQQTAGDLTSVMAAPADNGITLYSAVDLDALTSAMGHVAPDRQSAPAQEIAPRPPEIRIMGCGQNLPVKGADMFATVAGAVRQERANTSFTWIGGLPGTFPADSPTVHISTIPHAASHLAGGDIFVLSSRADQFPLVVLEAMALGLVVVAFDVGDVAEQIGDAGVLIRAGDTTAMTAAVIALVDDDGERSRLATAARARVAQRWGIDDFAAGVRTIADRAIAARAIADRAMADRAIAARGMADGRPVRVLHLMWRLSLTGGIQVVVRSIIGGIDPAAATMDIATVRPSVAGDELDSLPASVTMHPLGFAGTVSALGDVRIIRRFAVLVRRLRPDVVHLHSGTAWMGGIALRLSARRIPVVFEVHDAPGNGRHNPRTEAIEGRMARRYRWYTVTHSSSTRRDVEAVWRIEPDRSITFPLGVDLRRFTTGAERRPDGGDYDTLTERLRWRESNGVPAEAVVLICVARLVPSKGVDRLLDAFAAAARPSAHLVVVGGGPESDRLCKQAHALGIEDHVSFLGGLDHSVIPAALEASDIAVSASSYEGFGLTVVEAMAAGLPVVATSVGGVADLVVDGETGVLVPSNDVQALTRAMTDLIDDPEPRRVMAAAGRARAVGHFSSAALADRFASTYRRASARQDRC